MRNHEIESWVLQIIDQVVNNMPNEDDRVELKTEWIDPKKAARQIAGHANSSRGEPILWLIGVNERLQTVPGAEINELSNWNAQVKSQFDGVAPSLKSLNIRYQGVVVVALCFDTTRVPFVINNPAGGKIQFEVPWREGTSTRTTHPQG